MPPAARITDMHTCPMTTGPVPHVGGPILPPGAPTVLIDYLPATTVTSMATCIGPPDVSVKGSTGVFINYLPAARVGDLTTHGGVIVTGSPTVIIGEIGSGSPGSVGMAGIVGGMAAAGMPEAAGGRNKAHAGHGGSTPCAGHGLATPTSEKQFAHDMKKLQMDWPKLSPEQREQQMAAIANKQLAKSGVPPVGVSAASSLSSSTNGQMNFAKWNLDMNPALINSSQLSNKQTEDLGNTLYHESRHGEQWYMIARNEAGNGKNATDIEASTGMPDDVSKAAVNHPLSKKDQVYPCSQQMYESVYGKGASHRNTTLRSLPKLDDDYTKAVTQNNKVQADAASTLDERQAAYNNAQSALRKYQDGYNAYRALPEEADAWHAGDSVGRLLAH